MAIYEKFIGRTRDSFVSLKDCQENFKITYENDFNFAYDIIDVLGTEKPDKLALLYILENRDRSYHTSHFLHSNGVHKPVVVEPKAQSH